MGPWISRSLYLSIVVRSNVDVLGCLDVDPAPEAPDAEPLGAVDVDRVRGGAQTEVVAGPGPHRLRYEGGGELQICKDGSLPMYYRVTILHGNNLPLT